MHFRTSGPLTREGEILWRRTIRTGPEHPARKSKASLLLVGVWALAACAAQQASEGPWEPARLKRTVVSMKEARDRGDAEACIRHLEEGLAYVDASAVRSLDEYATLLHTLQRSEADTVRARANRLREAQSRPGSAYLGFPPAGELQGYVSLLQELGRTSEAEAIKELADEYDSAQSTHFQRLIWQQEGRDPNLPCR